jgi:hypothetical protein
MKMQEINKLEEDNTNKCYLIKDGIFWRAFEKSAFWFVNNLKPYAITKKHFKVLNANVAYLGFPDSVLNELLIIAETKSLTVNKQEKLVTISGFEISDGFERWKDEILYQTPDNQNISLVNEPVENYDSGLIDKIRKFPVAERTPIECQQFIIELQNTINGTI